MDLTYTISIPTYRNLETKGTSQNLWERLEAKVQPSRQYVIKLQLKLQTKGLAGLWLVTLPACCHISQSGRGKSSQDSTWLETLSLNPSWILCCLSSLGWIYFVPFQINYSVKYSVFTEFCELFSWVTIPKGGCRYHRICNQLICNQSNPETI